MPTRPDWLARLRGRASGAAFLAYLALSALFFGSRVVTHPQSTVVGGLATDQQIFVWMFAWWPHAILNGQNPFVTHAIWAPDGFNLAWATSVPALAVAFAPLTLLAGPILAYDLACILMPALSAWTAFLLCRRLTGAAWPSFAGGYLFGFSSYVLGGQLSHVNTVAVFLLPLAALLVLRFLDGELGAVGLAVAFGALLALQAYLWTELLFTLTLALAVSLLLGLVLVPALRSGLVRLLLPLAGAYAVALVLGAPLFWYVVTAAHRRPQPGAAEFVGDLLNFVVPTRASLGGWWGAGLAQHFPANDIERGAYLGLPTLIVVGWFAVRRIGTAAGRFLLAAFAAAAIATLGSWLTVNGHRVTTLPWIHVAHLPLFDNAMPVRLSVFTSLVAAVIVALWAASGARPAGLRTLLPALAVVALLPNFGWGGWARTPEVPALFTTEAYRSCLRRGENILPVPLAAHGDTLIWQAETGFRFRLAVAYVGPTIPEGFLRPGITHLTTADNPGEVTTAAVLELARLKSISAVVVDERRSAPWRRILDPLGEPQRVGGALIYRLPGSPQPAGCGHAPAR